MKLTLLLITLVAVEAASFAQYGTAPNGFYTSPYDGQTFTGKVIAVDQSSEAITISYENGKKNETFVGRLKQACTVASTDGKGMTALDLPIGTDVTVYFQPTPRKEGSTSVKENLIIGIMFHSWEGHPVKPAKKGMYPCAAVSWVKRCFRSSGPGCPY